MWRGKTRTLERKWAPLRQSTSISGLSKSCCCNRVRDGMPQQVTSLLSEAAVNAAADGVDLGISN